MPKQNHHQLNQMPLKVQEIQQILKGEKSQKRHVIPKAVRQQNRLTLHSKVTTSRDECSAYLTEFFQFVEKLLPSDKYEMFLTLFSFPVRTVNLSERIYKALNKIFDGRNPVFSYEFNSPEAANDWDVYRTKVLKSISKWKTEGFETMKTDINSIVIVDLPLEQLGDQPEPYFYFLSISDVLDYNTTDLSQIDWIVFKQPEGRVAVFDDTFYRVYKLEEGTNEVSQTPELESEHGLGYCPARFFWTTPLSYSEPDIKRSPISSVLSDLDKLLFFMVANEHLNLYGRYPIYSAFRASCNYQHKETGEYCKGGVVVSRQGYHLLEGKKAKPCPVCQKRRLDGPGSFIEIDPPSSANDKADLRNPVQITSIDRNSLDYNNEDIDRRSNEIYAAITGFQGMSINDKAVNEKQVIAIFETLESALKNPQENFEQVIQWVDNTICRLRYGNEVFVSSSISLGTEHYILTPSQLMEMYQQAKKASFSNSVLDLLEDKYYETEFRNNPEQLNRQNILKNLDPFRHKSDAEVAGMYAANAISYEDYMVKINFSTLIMKFERDFMPVTEYGINSPFDTRISGISDELYKYASEMKPDVSEVDPEPKPV